LAGRTTTEGGGMSNTTFATLPRNMQIGDVTYVENWKTKRHAVYQSYTTPIQHSGHELLFPQVAGSNEFAVFEVIQHLPAGESLGEQVASYSDLNAAMDFVAKEELLA
jgi:hypothetical protein